MRKVCFILALAIVAMTLCACTNYDFIDTNYKFDRAIIDVGGRVVEVNVKLWRDFEDGDQIQIEAEDGTVYLTDATRCVLIRDPEVE